MSDLLLILEAPAANLRLAVCTAQRLSQDAARRHQLADGSAAVLAQALTGALLLASTDDQLGANSAANASARVDVQLDCEGPLRGLLVDADGNGAVRGLVRVNGLDRSGARAHFDEAPLETEGAVRTPKPFSGARAGADLQFQPMQPLARFDPRPLLGAAGDRRAGSLSVLRAITGDESLHRAHVPFSGSDIGAGLSAFLRTERRLAGGLALEVLFQPREPLAAVAGALLLPVDEDQRDHAGALGDKLRSGILHQALLEAEAEAPGNAHALAHRLARDLSLGPVRIESELRPRFSCRCSRARVVHALQTLGPSELRDMAGKDGGAEATCDFCAEVYRIGATELLELAEEQPPKQ